MRGHILTGILLLVLLASTASAVRYTAAFTPIDDKIPNTGVAEFELAITNNDLAVYTFRVKTLDYPRWDLSTEPRINPILVEVRPGDTETIPLFIDPNQNYIGSQGSHFINVEISVEGTGESIVKRPTVGIVKDGSVSTDYVPTVTMETDFPETVNPREPITYSISLSNRNERVIEGASLEIRSSLFSEDVPIDLQGDEVKGIDVTIPLEPTTPPGEDILRVRLLYEGKDIASPIARPYEIASYSAVEGDASTRSGFLTRTETVTFTNYGNVVSEGTLRVEAGFWRRLFSSTTPSADVEDGAYVWQETLAPYEQQTVVVSENYLWLVVIIIALILAGLIVFLRRSPVVVEKQITETEADGGELSRMKVLITVRNRSTTPLEKVTVVDQLPKLLHMEKHAVLGSLRPKRIKQSKDKTTLILWDVDEIAPGEERVINYHIKSNLKILGGITLRPAIAKFKVDGKERGTRSNSVTLKL